MQWPSIPGKNWKKKDVCFMWPLHAPNKSSGLPMRIHVIVSVISLKMNPAALLMNYQMKDWINLLPEAICAITKPLITGMHLTEQEIPEVGIMVNHKLLHPKKSRPTWFRLR